jgi:hypothetical protein
MDRKIESPHAMSGDRPTDLVQWSEIESRPLLPRLIGNKLSALSIAMRNEYRFHWSAEGTE